ncbi:radical SAM/Cys-rich domain-containing protein [Mariprofundus ferrinatatus]|uniref:Radical SAM/Cys-rich domain-containing protein n=1 Tax=Mariprofundus ferrinatatus TaxID=1921087 RepID=A0A2K8L425_9PROT|nr:arsenosugar biosynthesis radical SAM (seleno)protein ArsS [Mariprofundus ferrinatatus]ATX82070.1 radical SAM/Cys-rich domain-containing protein [Mariprofundus ferrinatatus]
MHATLPLLKETDFPAINRGKLDTLQVNLGYLCNQTCLHCHVNAGPRRKEVMSDKTVQSVIDYLATHHVKTLDLTGGAPEMNVHFRYLVRKARELGLRIIDRCNLTILEEEGFEWAAGFLAEHKVEVVASLPCYLSDNVDAQRGKGVFDSSIRALKRLNQLGYGVDGSGLTLTLVYNPQGACLPPSQAELEVAYKRELHIRYGIQFNKLFTITNMPIQRFGSTLISRGEFASYMQLLKEAYSEDNLPGVMCRNLISIDWQGYVYDCDFNQMLDLPMQQEETGNRLHLRDLMCEELSGRPVIVMDHCYGCTAGQGSSCGGALDG